MAPCQSRRAFLVFFAVQNNERRLGESDYWTVYLLFREYPDKYPPINHLFMDAGKLIEDAPCEGCGTKKYHKLMKYQLTQYLLGLTMEQERDILNAVC